MIFESVSRCLDTLLVLGAREPEVLGPTGGRGGREAEGAALPMGAEGGKLGVFRGVLVVPTLESLAASVSVTVAVRAAVLATVAAPNREGAGFAAFEADPVA